MITALFFVSNPKQRYTDSNQRPKDNVQQRRLRGLPLDADCGGARCAINWATSTAALDRSDPVRAGSGLAMTGFRLCQLIKINSIIRKY